MNEKDHKTAMAIAQLSESVGMLFCIAGVVIGITFLVSGHLLGFLGLAMSLSAALPTLGVGLLLIVAGRILRAVSDQSNASAESPQFMQGEQQQNPNE